MSICKDLVPLSKVVAAAIVDSYEDKGKVESQYFHWAARTFKDLNRKYLKSAKRRTMLLVSPNTLTATLPSDVDTLSFVGTIVNGEKVPLVQNYKLVDSSNLDDGECIDRCPKCNQDKAICEDLEITETVNLILINGTYYDQTVVKKLYPNGDYYLETTNPVWNIEDEEVEYITSKQFIANLDLKPCGCLDTTTENLTTLQTCCPDVYACYYAACGCCDVDLGGYKVFEDTGLIQLQKYISQIYIEYQGFLPKVNGQLQIPQLAFEATVEGTKFRSVKNRKNISATEKMMYEKWASSAARDMHRLNNPISIDNIIELAMRTPKFDIKRNSWYNCFTSGTTGTASSSSVTALTSSSSTSTTTEVTVVRNGVAFGKRKFTIGESGSPMTEGQTVWTITTEAGVVEPNILANSVNVILDGISLQEEVDDQISPTIVYGGSNTTITFNQAVVNGQKYKVTYAKAI